MAGWMADGLISYREQIWEGLPSAPKAFAAMLDGSNFGKSLVRVSADPTLT
jgi:NADPH-dependent curcumin reductase CurA